MSQLSPRQNDAGPGQVYFDLTASNFQSTTSSTPVFEFNEARASPYLMNPSLYELRILRFIVDSTSMPLSVISIQPGQGDRDLTIYSVCLEYTVEGTLYSSGQVFVRWIA